jgi:hypothetical protein
MLGRTSGNLAHRLKLAAHNAEKAPVTTLTTRRIAFLTVLATVFALALSLAIAFA